MQVDRERIERIDLNGIAAAAEEKAHDLAPWSDYYRLRAKEMEILFSLYDIGNEKRILEIGCGNGFLSAILSKNADEVVSADLERPDARTHSVGISKAMELFNRLGIKKCRAVSCSCEDLPFEDGAFDLVFCAYTLEHIPDRMKALKEVRRVLREGGRAIFIVPAFMERLLYPFRYYSEIASKTVKALNPKGERKNGPAGVPGYTGMAAGSGSIWRKFKDNYPSFPLPDPHGEYPGYFSELVRSSSFIWARLIKKSGFTVKEIFTIGLAHRSFLAIFFGGRSLDIYEKTLWLNKKLGRNIFLKHAGENLCFVLEK